MQILVNVCTLYAISTLHSHIRFLRSRSISLIGIIYVLRSSSLVAWASAPYLNHQWRHYNFTRFPIRQQLIMLHYLSSKFPHTIRAEKQLLGIRHPCLFFLRAFTLEPLVIYIYRTTAKQNAFIVGKSEYKQPEMNEIQRNVYTWKIRNALSGYVYSVQSSDSV